MGIRRPDLSWRKAEKDKANDWKFFKKAFMAASLLDNYLIHSGEVSGRATCLIGTVYMVEQLVKVWTMLEKDYLEAQAGKPTRRNPTKDLLMVIFPKTLQCGS